MRSIKIIKHKQTEVANDTTAETKKQADTSTRKIVDTVKSWIAESQQRRRKLPRSLPALSLLILIAFAVALAQSPQSPLASTDKASTPEQRAIKVTIAATDGFLGPPATRYKVGERIPVTITMTNTSKEPLYTCISSDLYQDLPKLTRDGKAVPYMNWQSYETVNAERNHICEDENLPVPVLLRPNEPRAADWLVLVDDGTAGAPESWYDSLPAGKYELTIQRRLSCCEGPMVESNKINFEVVP